MLRNIRIIRILIGLLFILSSTFISANASEEKTSGEEQNGIIKDISYTAEAIACEQILLKELKKSWKKFKEAEWGFKGKWVEEEEKFKETLGHWFRIEHPFLTKAFPGVVFYNLESGISLPPPPSSTGALYNKKFYWMPDNFNELLLDKGMKITDENLLELAKAFILVSRAPDSPHPYSFAKIKFISASKINEKAWGGESFDAEVQIEIENKVQTWQFSLCKSSPLCGGQFETITVDKKGRPAPYTILNYNKKK